MHEYQIRNFGFGGEYDFHHFASFVFDKKRDGISKGSCETAVVIQWHLLYV